MRAKRLKEKAENAVRPISPFSLRFFAVEVRDGPPSR